MKTKKIFYFILTFFLFSFIFINNCYAAEFTLLEGISCAASKETECTLDDIEQIIVSLASFMLAITGSLSLLAFIVGGVMFIISTGNNERVSQAKRIISGALIGMIIVFSSYTIISFILKIFGIENITLSIIK